MKLIIPERESDALVSALAAWSRRLSSELALTEVVRAARRYGPPTPRAAEEALSLVALRPMDRELMRRAGLMEPLELRSLDAIHLATALALDPPPAAFLTYDSRLAHAARAAGLNVQAPA